MTTSRIVAPTRFRWVPARHEYFTALIFACGVNGLSTGLLDALRTSQLTISWITILGFALALYALIKAPAQELRSADLAIGAAAVLLLLWPLADTSWLAMSILAVYLLWVEPRGAPLHAGAAIALALTVQPFWGRLIPLLIAGPLERLDIQAVALLVGSNAHGNRMDFLHGPGGVVVAWGCTSFANGSLALLLWVALMRTFRPLPKRGEWLNLAGLFATVFAINTVRLALMAQNLSMQQRVHGPSGQFWAGLALLIASLAWCLFGLRRELVR